MKQFNLELAKAGLPVQTRDGRPARIVCFDKLDEFYPIVALVKNDYDGEGIEVFTIDGKYNTHILRSYMDLFMAPKKKEGWVNIYRSSSIYGARFSKVYDNKEEALKGRSEQGYITTTKIEWEE